MLPVGKLRIAMAQMTSSAEVATNLSYLEGLYADLKGQGIKALFLPENFAALGNPAPREVASAHGEEILTLLRRWSREAGTWTFAGTLPSVTRPDGSQVPDGRVRAASWVIDDNGELVARYDKIHMFDVEVSDAQRHYRESATFEPGTEVVVASLGDYRVGLTVCYDLRFPVLYQRLFAQQVDIILIPSAFTVPTGIAHFETLLRARAIESQAFVIAACQAGKHDSGRETYGHSMCVDPWGEVLQRGDAMTPGLLTVDLDMDTIGAVRERMPVLSQSRLD